MKREMKDFYTLITGASAGIGKALAVESAKRGKNLLLVALPNENLEKFSESLKKDYGIRTEFYETDLTQNGTCLALYDWCKKKGLKVNTLINNAGIGMGDYFGSFSHEYYEKMMQLNVISLVTLTRLFLAELKDSPDALILNVGSLTGFCPSPYKAVYAASKSFVNFFSLALREELRSLGIRVSVFCPGSIPTNQEVKQRIKNSGFLARISVLSAEHVARMALDTPGNTLKARKMIFKAFDMQIKEMGFSFVELLATCPTNWGLSSTESIRRLQEELIPYFPLGVMKERETADYI